MRVDYNSIGEECESIKESHKGGNSYGLGTTVFGQSSLSMGVEDKERKRAWSWCNHGGKILECN
jgi:hypothetical protein